MIKYICDKCSNESLSKEEANINFKIINTEFNLCLHCGLEIDILFKSFIENNKEDFSEKTKHILENHFD